MEANKHALMKVIIADDHSLFIDGLEQLINMTTGFEVVGKVTNGKLLMQTLNRLAPDMILLDIHMPFMGGLETALAIKKKFDNIKIIFVSMTYDARYKHFMITNEIDGFILKNVGASVLKDTLIKVAAGKKVFIYKSETPFPIVEIPETGFMKMFKLTKTEIEIIKLISEGLSTKMIADKRDLSELTIETHRKNIFRKLNAKNMADVVAFAVMQGIYRAGEKNGE